MKRDTAFTHDADPAPLSPAGRARRDAMLTDLQRAVTGAARRRRAIRACALLTPPAAALAIAVIVLNTTSTTRRMTGSRPAPTRPITSPHVEPAAPDPDPAPAYTMQHARFQIVDESSAARIITDPPSRVRTISDEELLHALREAGQDAGLIRMGGRVILTDNRPEPDEGTSSPLNAAEPPPREDPAV